MREKCVATVKTTTIRDFLFAFCGKKCYTIYMFSDRKCFIS